MGGVNQSLPAVAAEAHLSNLKASNTSTRTTREAPSLSVCPSVCFSVSDAVQAPATDLLAPRSPRLPRPTPLCTFRGPERLASQSQDRFRSTDGQRVGGRIPFLVGGCFLTPERQVYPRVVVIGGFCARASLAALISWPAALTGGRNRGGRGGKIDKTAEWRRRKNLTNRLYRLKSCSVCCPAERWEAAE